MEFSIKLKEENGIICTENNNKYILQTFLNAIDEFNKKCPKKGGILNRDHVGRTTDITHLTHSLKYENSKLVAEIELLVDGLENSKMRPIISTPLRIGSGVEIEIVFAILNIFLER
ncbi:MAG: hypothetical protein GF411_20565 [Candidatus Lokiarchaeota archaeon]|nr:hypothetical protein [Candidatus Lokiarchaeota archaeon]